MAFHMAYFIVFLVAGRLDVYIFPGTGTCCADVRPNLGTSLFMSRKWSTHRLNRGDARFILAQHLGQRGWGEICRNSYAHEMWTIRYDSNRTSKFESYCHYRCKHGCCVVEHVQKKATWSRNKMPEVCCKAAYTWDLIPFEGFHNFVTFISFLLELPGLVFFILLQRSMFVQPFFAVALAHFFRPFKQAVSNLQIWLKKNTIAICFKPWPWKCEDVLVCYSWPAWYSCGKPLLLRKVRE